MKKSFLMLLCMAAFVSFTACDKNDGDSDDNTVVNTDESNQTDDSASSSTDDSAAEEENTDTTDDSSSEEVASSSYPECTLEGSNYYVISLDSYSYEAISSNVVLDLRPTWYDGIEASEYVALWIWDGSSYGGTCSGLNLYGEAEEWTSLVAGSAGWSGFGYCLYLSAENGAKLNQIDDSYYFHVAYKSSSSSASLGMYLCGPDGTSGTPFTLGTVAFVDNGTTYALQTPVSGAFEAGAWNEYEIPLSSLGIDWGADFNTAGANICCFLGGGTAGTTIDLDAMFIYKK